MIAALVAVALSVSDPAPPASEVVLPGILDLPILQGGHLEPDCLGYRDRLSQTGETLECLGAPVSRVNDLVFAYRSAALERGWVDASGAANALWLTRVLPDGTCQRLTIAGMWDFERTPQPRPGDPGFIVISLDADARCPVQRPAP